MKKEFYVGITEPKEVRRNILESSKTFVQALQRCDAVNRTREEKQRAMLELKDTITEISTAATELKTIMPDYKISSLPKNKPEKKVKVMMPVRKKTGKAKTEKGIKKTEKKETDINRLQKELSTIETKLRGL